MGRGRAEADGLHDLRGDGQDGADAAEDGDALPSIEGEEVTTALRCLFFFALAYTLAAMCGRVR